jgi:hypothetical protein
LLRTERGTRRSAGIFGAKEDVIFWFTVWVGEQEEMKGNMPVDRKGFDGQQVTNGEVFQRAK